MVYLTQLVYVNDGEERTFQAFEDVAIPLISKYRGELLLRIRPNAESIISTGIEVPYEIHIVRFDTEDDFQRFSEDEERQKALHLKTHPFGNRFSCEAPPYESSVPLCHSSERPRACASFEIGEALLLRQPLNRVTQHRPGHMSVPALQKTVQRRSIAVADLAQHPADGLVDQIVGIVQQPIGDEQGLVELFAPDEMKRRNNGNSPLPDRR